MIPDDRLSTPTAIDDDVEALLTLLGVAPTAAVWLPFVLPKHFNPEVRECHINACLQLKYEKVGRIVSGWLIWQHKPSRTAEAHFHSCWANDTGHLIDVTPREDGELTVLFAPDASRVIRLTDVNGRPAIKTYDKVCISAGRVVRPVREAIGILTTDLIYSHGLASRAPTGHEP